MIKRIGCDECHCVDIYLGVERSSPTSPVSLRKLPLIHSHQPIIYFLAYIDLVKVLSS